MSALGVGKGRLRAALKDLGGSMTSWTVLNQNVDPFRFDTPANHQIGRWLASTMDRLGITEPIHTRGLHYALLTQPKPDGEPYETTDWVWLGGVSNAARWLGYVPFDQITDQRNDAPLVRLWRPQNPHPWVSVDFEITVPNYDDLEPYVGIDGFDPKQPYHLAFVGEKSSLRKVLEPIADRYQADLYLPTGNISNTMVHTLAKTSAADGRPLVVFYFADCDPSGWNMTVEVARKLQAFKIQLFPDLEFQCHRVGLTPNQVREYDLPVSPVKETDKRRDRWKDATGLEQTEIDALATLQPDLLRQIATDAVIPFYDNALRLRVDAARWEWKDLAQQAVTEQAGEHLDALRIAAAEKLAEKRSEIQQILDTVRVDADAFNLPSIPPIPQAVISSAQPEPLCDSRWPLAEQINRLKASKRYEATPLGGALGGAR